MAESPETNIPNPSATSNPTTSSSNPTTSAQAKRTSQSTPTSSSTPSSAESTKSGDCELLRGSCKNEVKFIAKNTQGGEIKVCEEHKNLVNEQYPNYQWEFEEI